MKNLLIFTFFILFIFSVNSTYYPGYTLSNVKQTSAGFTGDLAMISAGPYGDDIATLKLLVNYQTNNRLRVKIYDPNNQRWEVPGVSIVENSNVMPSDMDYDVTYTTNPFGLKIVRKSDQEVLFDTTPIENKLNGLIFEDQYIEISTQLEQDPLIFGIGERTSNFTLKHNQDYTLYARGDYHGFMTNWYGSHPVYYQLGKTTGKFHSVFLLNSNAMDVSLTDNSLTYKTIGGILDFFIFTGGSLDETTQQYTEVIGKPIRVPYWTLGWHQCRWGWKSIDFVEGVVDSYKKYSLPLDTVWADIDYMDQYKDFTLDPVNYATDKVQTFVSKLHTNDMHYIMIVDPAIKVEKGYEAYDLGNEMNVWTLNPSNIPFWGIVWPGTTYFPDFTHPNTTSYWTTNLKKFHDLVDYDSLWIDMNEPANFVEVCSDNQTNYPYTPGKICLDQHTVSLDSKHYISTAYNLHNLYGYTETVATRAALNDILPGKRTLVLSRSTFAGHGRHGQHWLGDNYSTWESMKESIAGILNMGLFGVSMVGADICGFQKDTTEELCTRWMQLGSFYPFSRNHNAFNSKSQLPYIFSEQMTNISRSFLMNRYSLLPYFYTLYESSSRTGSPMWRAMMYDYPKDSFTWNLDKQFMVGDSLMVLPMLEPSKLGVEGYFPNDNWYDWWSGKQIMEKLNNQDHGLHIEMLAPIDTIPVNIKGGSIIPTQIPALTSAESRQNPFELTVALDPLNKASGWLYADDGESIEVTNKFSEITFAVANNVLKSTIVASNYDPLSQTHLSKITVLGVKSINSVTVNGKEATFEFDAKFNILRIENISLDLNQEFTVQWN
ncbi:acid alpha glucosidase relate [Anaeramoeba flamelloides]|uniref:alpha-glucosidase n=1 Tax=Anaeramoeba flamelloides TaxID=1746091 RepID=A0AAV7ZQH0_9EUKA|nr:acid alpha glucosidase relate [Anaeramoeba flamelloides]KAJ6252294.1 acid alpha glucosidase relate [Anaeramoeba flamelloides]|eukprot:Anaeramoba_flamelloidesa85740_289.p1 GENE.a85740_289~~a85740_289.p1  ORF type:complete len:829 (+),score=143.16 a85740_289:51-2537(+)